MPIFMEICETPAQPSSRRPMSICICNLLTCHTVVNGTHLTWSYVLQ